MKSEECRMQKEPTDVTRQIRLIAARERPWRFFCILHFEL